jgi:hypothetical protein
LFVCLFVDELLWTWEMSGKRQTTLCHKPLTTISTCLNWWCCGWLQRETPWSKCRDEHTNCRKMLQKDF